MDKKVTFVLSNAGGCNSCACQTQPIQIIKKEKKLKTKDDAPENPTLPGIPDIYKYIDEKMQEQYESMIKVVEMQTRVVNTRLDDIVRDVANLSKARNYQEYIFDQKLKRVDDKLVEVEDALKGLEKRNKDNGISANDSALIREIKLKLVELEDRIIGSNDLVFEGVHEDERFEDAGETEEKVRDIIRNSLCIDDEDIVIERAHRVGERAENSAHPRSIIVQFCDFKDKEAILRRASEVKHENSTGVSINSGTLKKSSRKPVLEDRDPRKPILQDRGDGELAGPSSRISSGLKRYRAEGKYAVIKFDKMHVKGKWK